MEAVYISMFPYVFLGIMPFMTGGGTYNSVCADEYNAVDVSSSSTSEEDDVRLRPKVVWLTGCSPS